LLLLPREEKLPWLAEVVELFGGVGMAEAIVATATIIARVIRNP